MQFRVTGHFSTPPENWTVRAFLQLTPHLSNDFTAAWLTFTFPQLFAVAATLKSIDYNVAMTFILNNNNNNYNKDRSLVLLRTDFVGHFTKITYNDNICKLSCKLSTMPSETVINKHWQNFRVILFWSQVTELVEYIRLSLCLEMYGVNLRQQMSVFSVQSRQWSTLWQQSVLKTLSLQPSSTSRVLNCPTLFDGALLQY